MTQTSTIDTDTRYGSVVEQLLAQHQQVRAAIYEVAGTTTARSRQEAFDKLRDLLERHETAEEMIVHPLTGRTATGEPVANARTEEEDDARDALAELVSHDIASVEFARTFERFAKSVLAHAEREEKEELPLLREQLDAVALKNAETELLMIEETAG